MNPFDAGVVSFLNSFARRSWAFDTFVSVVLDDQFIKAGIIVTLLWWVWFQTDEREEEQREFVLFGIVSSFLSYWSSQNPCVDVAIPREAAA